MTLTEATTRVSAMTITVAIVEDDAGIRANLEDILGRSRDCKLIESFPNAETAIARMPSLKPDVVLMDINLPGRSGIECVAELKSKIPETQFIMLTVYEDSEWLFKALLAG